jgi:lipopolysaccharide biosynthesis glycosyltransferase
MSRFLVPYLCDYEGWAIFMDCDMLVVGDIAELWDERDESFAVQVVKHDHKPKSRTKMLGQEQTRYEKKNWSSVMLFNCGGCRALTPDYVNGATGLELHQFKWLDEDGDGLEEELIGELPHGWNYLVGYDDPGPEYPIKNIHYTEGGPWWDAYENVQLADLWRAERARMMSAEEIVPGVIKEA